MRGRTVLYVLLALTVPTGAFALTGGDDGVESLSVSASLDNCGIASDSIVCRIDASWNDLPGATRYTATVARADGTVVDYGDVGGGSASFWVPYAGNGTYTVTVSAYGTPPGADDQEVIAKASSSADRGGRQPEALDGGEIAGTDDAGDPADETGDTDEPGCEEAPPEEPAPEAPAADPQLEDQEPAEPPEAAAAAPAGEPEADELSAADEQALDDEAQTPEPVDCPAG